MQCEYKWQHMRATAAHTTPIMLCVCVCGSVHVTRRSAAVCVLQRTHATPAALCMQSVSSIFTRNTLLYPSAPML